MRAFFQKYGAYLSVGMLALAGVFFYVFNRPVVPRIPTKAFFFDEDTGQETLRPLTDVPPLKGAKGNDSLVRAYKFSCDDLKTAKVAYYYKYTPKVKARLEEIAASGKGSDYDPSNGELVRGPEAGSQWVPVTTDVGQQLTTIRCPDGHPISIVLP